MFASEMIQINPYSITLQSKVISIQCDLSVVQCDLSVVQCDLSVVQFDRDQRLMRISSYTEEGR